MDSPRISACMVLYHSGDQAVQAIRCLEESDVEVETYVVDNAPGDGVAERLRWMCPGIRYLPMARNVGFGCANNQVLDELHSDYHLILNPDVTFAPDLLSRMVAYMDANPGVAVLTPRVFSPDGTEQFLPKRQPTVRYLAAGLLSRIGLGKGLRAEYTMANTHVSTPIPVQFATGCFLLIRTAVFKGLNGFDERFFLYQEDSDLSRRAMQMGEIIYHPEMVVTHAWARENTRTFRGFRHQVRSVVRFFDKWGWRF